MQNRDLFSLCFFRRTLFCFAATVFFFFFTALRVASVASSDYSVLAAKRNALTLSLGTQQGTVYDCNLVPLTNSNYRIMAAVSPDSRAAAAVSDAVTQEVRQTIEQNVKKGIPTVCELKEEVAADGVYCAKIYSSVTAQTPATHLIGYSDASGKGQSGLLSAYSELLCSEPDVTVCYQIDAKGRILAGIPGELSASDAAQADAVVTTLDVNIQSIAEQYAAGLEKGAVLIAEAATGKIRGCVSRPGFNPADVAEYLDQADSPLFNRFLAAYNVGSVFKPCVSLAGIDAGKENFTYSCTGNCKIFDRTFNCHKRSGHGFQNLGNALANSCNTFFYRFASEIGAENICRTARKLSFGQKLKLCDGIYTAAGNLPDLSDIDNESLLADFCIGQGKLLLSPVSMLTLYCAIASGGEYYVPSVVEGTVSKGTFTAYDKGGQTRVTSPETAARLRSYLQQVLTEGTGREALPLTVSAAGKTATAQTGRFRNGKEIDQGWFCGFFPAEKPEYVVIVFSEDVTKQTLSNRQIFALVADAVTALTKK